MRHIGLGIAMVGIMAGGCAGNSQHPELRALLDEAPYTLRQSVDVAVEATPGDAERATLVTRDPVFSIDVVAASARTDVRVSPMTGQVVSSAAAGASAFACPDAIPLAEALAIAESAADGEAIQSVPDDDVDCAFEIQVLAGESLIEVKVGPDGAVLEQEPSDEFGGGEDDD